MISVMPETSACLNSLNPVSDDSEESSVSVKKEPDEINWDVDIETTLFDCLIGLKPVGVNRFFMMAVLHRRFAALVSKELTSQSIWDRLDTLYDMAALHESEIVPYPNEEEEYELPEEYFDLILEKFGVNLHHTPEKSKADIIAKNSKKTNVSKLKQNAASSSPKSPFLAPTPVSGKSSKLGSGIKHETKTPVTEIGIKVKQETPVSSKSNKVKASSPFTTKNGKSELSVKEELSGSTTKKSKADKTPKIESSASSSSKNSLKQVDTPESVTKKNKTDKDVLNKKNNKNPTSDNSSSKKNVKNDKKSDVETTKKSIDNSAKIKNSAKSKTDDDSYSSGSRKSSTPKVGTSDKKKKRQRSEESSKKSGTASKRRRV